MCGIAGATWMSGQQAVSARTLDRMTDVVQYRGPDGRGTWRQQYDNGQGVALGHRRLAIIDVEGGKQPMCNEDGTVWITFNGEIYNYPVLREQLIAQGHRFATHSDTETIVHLYEQFGEACLEKLRGMFAFAIWDQRKRKLFMARDRLGQKPLVYRNVAGQLLFGSAIKSILQVPGIQRSVNPAALNLYLSLGYVPHPHTMFEDIHKLPPAHFAVFQSGRLEIKRYWKPDWECESDRPLEEIQEELRHELTEAVRLRLRSDVPVGAFLSGGVDSTTIVGLMQDLMEQPAKTFTMGVPVKQFDESAAAQRTAERFGTDHHQLSVNPASIDLLPFLSWHFDEPFGDSSALPTCALSQGTRQHVKVALTGDGGDELFAGYPRYKTVDALERFDRLPEIAKRLLNNGVWRWLPAATGGRSALDRLKFRMNILQQHPNPRYLNWVAVISKPQRTGLLREDFCDGLQQDPERVIDEAMSVSNRTAGSRAMMCDLQTYLPGDLLTKVDITSMAHGLECRSPFMDQRVVELALAIPFHHQIDARRPKPVLTHTFDEKMSNQLLKGAKRGFSLPLNQWFRGPLKEFARALLLSDRAKARGYFRAHAIDDMLKQHAGRRWNHGDKIWSLICLEQWHRDYIDPTAAPNRSPIASERVSPATQQPVPVAG